MIETIKTLFIDYNAEKDEDKQKKLVNDIKTNYKNLFTIDVLSLNACCQDPTFG